jgi:hypothetical protein
MICNGFFLFIRIKTFRNLIDNRFQHQSKTVSTPAKKSWFGPKKKEGQLHSGRGMENVGPKIENGAEIT